MSTSKSYAIEDPPKTFSDWFVKMAEVFHLVDVIYGSMLMSVGVA
jgi:hypothetical protein